MASHVGSVFISILEDITVGTFSFFLFFFLALESDRSLTQLAPNQETLEKEHGCSRSE